MKTFILMTIICLVLYAIFLVFAWKNSPEMHVKAMYYDKHGNFIEIKEHKENTKTGKVIGSLVMLAFFSVVPVLAFQDYWRNREGKE